MKITELRLVFQEWYETEYSKTGWDSYGWRFKDDGNYISDDWKTFSILNNDKFGNEILGIVQKITEI